MKKYKILDYNSTLLSYNLAKDLRISLDKNSSTENNIPQLELDFSNEGYVVARNLPCAVLDRVNLNQTIFSTELLDEIINFNNKYGFFKNQKLISAMDHPLNENLPNFKNGEISHAVTNLFYKDINDLRVLFCDFIIYNSTEGLNLQAYLVARANLGLSIRGFIYDYNDVGDGIRKFTDYEILGIDIVTTPSNLTLLNMKYTTDGLLEGLTGEKNSFDKNSKRVEEKKYFNDGSYYYLENLDNIDNYLVIHLFNNKKISSGDFKIDKELYYSLDFTGKLKTKQTLEELKDFFKSIEIKEDKNSVSVSSLGAISSCFKPVNTEKNNLKKIKTVKAEKPTKKEPVKKNLCSFFKAKIGNI